MKDLHSEIDKGGFGYIVDENNQYYQPKIKTARKPFIHIETGTKIGEEVTTTYKICTDDCISKTKLISFFKDKIKEIENTQEIIINENEVILTSKKEKLDLLNEILDFVNKGGKE